MSSARRTGAGVPALLGMVLALSAGCGEAEQGVVDGPLLTAVEVPEATMLARLSGRLTLDGDCLLLHGDPVVWPAGTTFDPAVGVSVPGNDPVALGERAHADGGTITVDDARELFGDGVADAASACVDEGGVTVVLGEDVRGGRAP